jgi:hypothetical protein
MDTRVKPAYDGCFWSEIARHTLIVILHESGGTSTLRPLD